MAIDLQIALPPTVKLEMKAVNKTDIMLKLMLVELLTDIARTAPMEPLIIPQISPITSLQILEILLEFLSKPIVPYHLLSFGMQLIEMFSLCWLKPQPQSYRK